MDRRYDDEEPVDIPPPADSGMFVPPLNRGMDTVGIPIHSRQEVSAISTNSFHTGCNNLGGARGGGS
jgi:hypothetical protein